MKNTTAEPASSHQRIIKKYPNRRLYDTETSSYITLSEVKALVMKMAPSMGPMVGLAPSDCN